MTTREEFALGFALSAYAVVMKELMNPGRKCPEVGELEKLDRDTIRGAVEMADLLLAELQKPPVKVSTPS